MLGGQLENLAKAMRLRGFDVKICADRDEAVEAVLAMVRAQHAGGSPLLIGSGNSDTVRATGILERIGPYAADILVHQPAGTAEADRRAQAADIYLTSANAVSLDGQIINIDGTGNRTASTCYGPRQVIFLIARNKIAATLDDALARARQAAVALCRRYGRKTPCVATGQCEDCLSPECICAVTVIHRKKPYGVNLAVILIDEDLGV